MRELFGVLAIAALAGWGRTIGTIIDEGTSPNSLMALGGLFGIFVGALVMAMRSEV